MRKSWVLILVAILLVACEKVEIQEEKRGADTVYTNGKLYTLDPDRSWAQAVAVTDGRISFVGTSQDAKAIIGSATKVIDLGGRMMLPGFQDAHIHPIMSGIEAASCSLGGAEGIDEYRSLIKAYAEANPDLPWITGGGWSMAVFGAGGAPSRHILDELVPDRPVYLVSSDGHSAWVNTKALELSGVTTDTPDPSNGRIDRDSQTGELVGSLQEGAMELITPYLPEVTLQDRLDGLAYARDMLHSYGITGFTDAIVTEQDLEAYTHMDQLGELNLRVQASLWLDAENVDSQIPVFIEQREKFSQGHISANSIKIMQDGVLENYTAAMLEPYLEGGGTRGIPMFDPDKLKVIVAELDANDFQVHFHAIGDAAIRQSLDAVEHALDKNGQLGHRHHISHLQVIHPDDIERFAELEVVANFQPLWAAYDDYIVELNVPALGRERVHWMYPIKSILETGGKVAFGSDWSVSTANPFHQIETAVTRVNALENTYEPFIPEEAISVADAIAAFTLHSAWVNQLEADTGSIEVGKFADLVVLDQNLLEIAPNYISDTKVLLTLFEGEVVYGSNDL